MIKFLALLSVLIPISLFAQGFGSFSHDQPYFAANESSGLPIPTGNIFVWLKPETLMGTNGTTTNGVGVNYWADSSGLNHHGTNDNGQSPYLTNSILNGYSGVKVSANSHGQYFFNVNGGLSINRNLSGTTLHMVIRKPDTSDREWIYFGSPVFGVRLTVGTVNSGQLNVVANHPDSTPAQTFSSAVTAPSGVFRLYSIWIDYTNAICDMYTNSILGSHKTSFGGTSKTTDSDSLANTALFGGNGTDGDFNGELVEFLCYTNWQTGADLTNVFLYFKNKFSIW